ncbi:MAG: hypothetical protein DPW14_09275 [Planctomycetes bacterium]|nr:hypothetical protein [Planctomycetota bacterium]
MGKPTAAMALLLGGAMLAATLVMNWPLRPDARSSLGRPDTLACAQETAGIADPKQPQTQPESPQASPLRNEPEMAPESGSPTGAGTNDRPAGSAKTKPPDPSVSPHSSPGEDRPNQLTRPPAPLAPARIIDAAVPPNQNLGATKPKSKVLIRPDPKVELSDVPEKLKQDRRGLFGQYWAFNSDPLAELAQEGARPLSQRKPDLERIDSQVYFADNDSFSDLPFSRANFAVRWEGFLVVPRAATYWFILGCDNAGRVDINDETVLLNQVQTRYVEVSTALELAPGLHSLRVEFAQGMLSNEDSWRCACKLMWVPPGESRPVALAPEMLMLPRWMWSDDAPIITRLSKGEGEVGDEITIYGQGLCDAAERKTEEGPPALDDLLAPQVDFNGQRAKVLKYTPRELTVKVPIGASSGRLMVVRHFALTSDATGNHSGPLNVAAIPSNSVEFRVTTQFGLLAHWYNLNNVPNVDFDGLATRIVPEIVRIEPGFEWVMRGRAPVPFAKGALACSWEGYLGVPHGEAGFLCIDSVSPIRVVVGDLHQEPEPSSSTDTRHVRIWIGSGDERKLPLRVVWIADTDSALFPIEWESHAQTGEVEVEGLRTPIVSVRTRRLPACLLFPPIVPSKPPAITKVWPGETEAPLNLPFETPKDRPSIAEGQAFQVGLHVFRDTASADIPLELFVDGMALTYKVAASQRSGTEGKEVILVDCVLPPSCGEGKLTAKLGLAVSEPFFIDVANKGLVAFLYDLPNPGGYSQFPDVPALTCHSIRKERTIDFTTVESFTLPFVAETFAIEWFGAIIVKHEGWYRFTVRSDDGCRVWVNGAEIINDDNLHAPREAHSDWLRLLPGVHSFRMQYFENTQHECCTLYWEARDPQDNLLIERQVVPSHAFTWVNTEPLPDKPPTGKRADGSSYD